jgi:hypothetical protein
MNDSKYYTIIRKCSHDFLGYTIEGTQDYIHEKTKNLSDETKRSLVGAMICDDQDEVIGYVSESFTQGYSIFDKAFTSQETMCDKQNKINSIIESAEKLITAYNAVVRNREWIAMQAVASVNGFTYTGPWIAKEIGDLAETIKAAKLSTKEDCHDRPNNSCCGSRDSLKDPVI